MAPEGSLIILPISKIFALKSAWHEEISHNYHPLADKTSPLAKKRIEKKKNQNKMEKISAIAKANITPLELSCSLIDLDK